MKTKRTNQELVLKIVVIGVLTALAIALCLTPIRITAGVSITLVLPVVVIGAALYGPWIGAWLTIIPNIIAFFVDGALFMTYNPVGGFITILLKGILAGIAAGFICKALQKRLPMVAITCASIAAPIINTGVFLLGSYFLVWDKMVEAAIDGGIAPEFAGIAVLLGLGINFALELILNIVLAPAIFKILQIITKKKLV